MASPKTAWLVSLFVHGIVIAGALSLHRPMAPLPEAPFRWDVTLHEAVPVSVEHPPATSMVEAPAKNLSSVKTVPAIHRSVSEAQQVFHEVVSDDRMAVPFQQSTVRPIQSIVSPTETGQLVKKSEAVERSALHARDLVQERAFVVVRPVVTRVKESGESTLVTKAAVVEAQADSTRAALPAVTRSEISREPSQATESAIVEAQPISTAVVQTPEFDHPPVVADDPLVQERTAIQTRQARAVPGVQARYGWLKDALTDKIQQMKRYPEVAAEHRWEGRVVVRGVIMDTGELKDLVIVESSGFHILDDEAVALLRRISPLTFKHPLGQPQVSLRIPIHYRIK